MAENGNRMSRRPASTSPFAALAVVAAVLAGVVPAAPAWAADWAIVFMYHRFGEPQNPSTNVTIEQFEAHLEEIARGGYNVVPLPDIIAAFRRKEALPERTIALSIDDAFLSVHAHAWPRLRKAGLPFTLFVATKSIDAGHSGYMSWSQLRELAAAGVTIGSQTANHPHLPAISERALATEFAYSNARFREELGFVPDLLAYPYGEFGLREKKAARASGFVAAFGQHSGVAYASDDLYGLPRFAMNERFGSVQRFRLAGNALPLRVHEITPADTVLRDNNPPSFGFTVDNEIENLRRLACFASNQDGPARLERLGQRRFEVRIERAFQPGRGRINCTIPAPGGRWRWFGMQFFIPKK